MIEVLPDLSDFRYRLIGTYVTEYFLTDATGKTVTRCLRRTRSEPRQRRVKALLRKTARDKVPVRAFGDAGWIAPGFEEFDALYLPLSDDGETVNMILHGFVFDKPQVMMAREIARATWRRTAGCAHNARLARATADRSLTLAPPGPLG